MNRALVVALAIAVPYPCYNLATARPIRSAVEGGGPVKAELVTVGQSGEQSLKRIESVGDRASGGLTTSAARRSCCARASARLVLRSPA